LSPRAIRHSTKPGRRPPPGAADCDRFRRQSRNIPSERDAGLKALQAKVPADVLKTASSDASGYDQFVQLGRLYGGTNNFAGAENAIGKPRN
jgi:hypothetical protein